MKRCLRGKKKNVNNDEQIRIPNEHRGNDRKVLTIWQHIAMLIQALCFLLLIPSPFGIYSMARFDYE